MTYNENWTTKKPRQGELQNMPAPAAGVTRVKVSEADDFIYLLLNFITETGSLRGQWVDDQYIVTSYGTPIAISTSTVNFLNATFYSTTTQRHLKMVENAWSTTKYIWKDAEALPLNVPAGV